MAFAEPPLFDLPDPPPVPTKSRAQVARELRPRWTRQGMQHHPCDQCVRELHDAGGVGPLPRGATMVRTVAATGDVTRLCPAHGNVLKAADQPGRRPARVTR